MSILGLAAAGLLMLQSLGSELAAAEAERLDACIAKIETAPEEAYEDGLAWTFQGNRPGARQCTALALIGIGNLSEGARRLESLATSTDAGTMEQRAVYFSQAGNAWLQAGVPAAAITNFSNALKVLPRTPDLLIDRASAHLMVESWDAAIADLDTAIEVSPGDPVAHQLRAKAYLNDGEPERALKDVEAAMLVDPRNLDTLLVRGQVREAIGIKAAQTPRQVLE